MSLGKPAITAPNALQLQAIQQAIQNISERFRRTDAVLSSVEATGVATTTLLQKTTSEIRTVLTTIEKQITVIQDSGSGEATQSGTFYASGTVAYGDPVWLSGDGQVSRLDPESLTSCSGYIGLASSDITAGQVTVQFIGVLTDISGGPFVTGRAVYAKTGGGVTQDPTGNALLVGVAVNTTDIAVSGTGGQPVLTNPYAGDPRDDYLPTSFALVKALLAEFTPSSGGVLPVVTGEVPPVLVYFEDGSLLYSGV